MKKLLSLLAIASLLFAACCKDDNSSSRPSYSVNTTVMEGATYQPKTLVKAILQSPYMKSNIGENAIATTGVGLVLDRIADSRHAYLDTVFARKTGTPQNLYERNWQIESYTFRYQSVTSKGEPVTLSGRVTFPTAMDGSAHTVQSLSIYTHYFINKNSVPSYSLSLSDLRVLFNSAVIQPDLQGYGVSGSLPYCGFSFETEGWQIYDCVRAACEIMRAHGVTLADDGYTTCWGYSIAMPATMAFARIYDESLSSEERNRLRLKSLFVGGGPMLMDRVLEIMDSDLDYNASLLHYVFPLLDALPSSSFGGYELKDFTADWMQTYMVTIEGQQYTYYDALMQGFSMEGYRPNVYDSKRLKNHFASDMCTAEGHIIYDNPKMQTLMSLFKRLCDWGAWQPSMDVYITHCATDNRMPIEQNREFYEMKKSCGRLHWKELETPFGKMVYGSDRHSGATFEATLTAMLYEDPKTAFEYSK